MGNVNVKRARKVRTKEILKNYGIFLIGLAFVSFGIAFVTKAALGISPISAIPYSLSLILPRFSLGNWFPSFWDALLLPLACIWNWLPD